MRISLLVVVAIPAGGVVRCVRYLPRALRRLATQSFGHSFLRRAALRRVADRHHHPTPSGGVGIATRAVRDVRTGTGRQPTPSRGIGIAIRTGGLSRGQLSAQSLLGRFDRRVVGEVAARPGQGGYLDAVSCPILSTAGVGVIVGMSGHGPNLHAVSQGCLSPTCSPPTAASSAPTSSLA